MYNECDEVAENMPTAGIKTHDDAINYVRRVMPGESETIISNVAFSLYCNAINSEE